MYQPPLLTCNYGRDNFENFSSYSDYVCGPTPTDRNGLTLCRKLGNAPRKE
jgi:hypothetical protein